MTVPQRYTRLVGAPRRAAVNRRMDWDRLIRDTVTALRTGEPVGIDDYGEGDVRPEWGAVQPLAVETQESCPT